MMTKRLIDANALIIEYCQANGCGEVNDEVCPNCFTAGLITAAPSVDAVPMDALEAWLYEIAMNNTDNTLGGACEEIIRRLDGLRSFVREREVNGQE